MKQHANTFDIHTRRSSIRRTTKRWMTAGLMLIACSPAWAFQVGNGARTGGGGGTGGTMVDAPEIDPALAVGATVLLVGGVLILTSRRRRVPVS